jgi:hypothetical protein
MPIVDHFPQLDLDTRHHLPFAAPIIEWLLHCCLPLLLSFVIARRRATVNALIAGHFLPPMIIDRCPQASLSPATACLCCFHHWLVVALLSAACFCHCRLSCNCQHSCCWLLLMPIVDHFAQVVLTLAAANLCCSHHWLVVALLSADCFCHCMLICDHQRFCCRLLLPSTINRCPQGVLPPATACLCCSYQWLVVALFSTACFCHCTLLCDHQCSYCWPLLPLIVDCCSQAVSLPAAACFYLFRQWLICSSSAKQRQQQHHHQRTNGSLNVKTFTSPDSLDLFNLSLQYLKCVMLVEGI